MKASIAIFILCLFGAYHGVNAQAIDCNVARQTVHFAESPQFTVTGSEGISFDIHPNSLSNSDATQTLALSDLRIATSSCTSLSLACATYKSSAVTTDFQVCFRNSTKNTGLLFDISFNVESLKAYRGLILDMDIRSSLGTFLPVEEGSQCVVTDLHWLTYSGTYDFNIASQMYNTSSSSAGGQNVLIALQGPFGAGPIPFAAELGFAPIEECPGWQWLTIAVAAATVVFGVIAFLVDKKHFPCARQSRSKEAEPLMSPGTRQSQAIEDDVEAEKKSLRNDAQETEEQAKQHEIQKKIAIALTIYTVTLIFTRSVDFVLYVRLAYKMKNYIWLLSSIILPIAFLIMITPIYAYKLCTNKISKEMMAVSKWKYAFMAAMDAAMNLLSSLPAPFLSGALNVVIPQSVIFVNMIASLLFLRTRYRFTHVAGAVIVFGGICIAVYPQMCEGGDTQFYWVLLLFSANIPAAISNVYKEHALKKFDLDVWYLNWWVSLFQLVWGIVLAPTVFVPILSGQLPQDTMQPSEFPQYIVNGFKCFIGISTEEGDVCGCQFGETWAVFLFFMVFNLIYNMSSLYVFKFGSATLAVVAGAIRLALSDFGFSILFLAGEAFQLVRLTDILALLFLIGGVVFYKLVPESKRHKKGDNDEKAETMEEEPVHSPTAFHALASDEVRQRDRAMSYHPFQGSGSVFFRASSVTGACSALDWLGSSSRTERFYDVNVNKDIRANYISKLGFTVAPKNEAEEKI